MTTYAMAHLKSVDLNAEIAEYLLKIDDTLVPFGGRFLVHGQEPEVVDGEFEGVIVVIEFPDRERARRWYESEAYQEIVGFRVNNSIGGAFVVDGVADNYRAADLVGTMGS